MILKPKIFSDSRGYFFESYNKKKLHSIGIFDEFVQDNQSFSSKGTLRGLHFQTGPSAQSKLVRVIDGIVYDVAVDLRKNSPTYGQHFGIELTGSNQLQFYIPRGFAHGFVVLSETALFAYKCDNFYDPTHEGGIKYNDQDLAIDWKIDPNIVSLSEKDKINPCFKDFNPEVFQ